MLPALVEAEGNADFAGTRIFPSKQSLHSALIRGLLSDWVRSRTPHCTAQRPRISPSAGKAWRSLQTGKGQLLVLSLFSPTIAHQEIEFYKSVQNPNGLPLDNREKYTKLDWILWTATLAESRGDFDALLAPVMRFLNETPDRVPMSDWYWTHDGKWRGFQARSVVGGVFIKALADDETWRKWRAKK